MIILQVLMTCEKQKSQLGKNVCLDWGLVVLVFKTLKENGKKGYG